MKPLELIIYPTWTGLDGTIYCSAFQYKGRPRPVDLDRLPKRLTDPELAAEYHAIQLSIERKDTHYEQNMSGGMKVRARLRNAVFEETRRRIILHRFATEPHYDEQP